MSPSLAITTTDGLVAALVVLLAVRGAFRGFVWQALRTGGLVAGFWLAGRWNAALGRWLADRFALVPRVGSDVCGWVVVFVGVFFVATLLAHLARAWVAKVRLGRPDRWAGALLGAVLGLGLATVGFVLWASLQRPEDLEAAFRGSHTVAWMARLVRAVKPLFPETVVDRWASVIEGVD